MLCWIRSLNLKSFELKRAKKIIVNCLQKNNKLFSYIYLQMLKISFSFKKWNIANVRTVTWITIVHFMFSVWKKLRIYNCQSVPWFAHFINIGFPVIVLIFQHTFIRAYWFQSPIELCYYYGTSQTVSVLK